VKKEKQASKANALLKKQDVKMRDVEIEVRGGKLTVKKCPADVAVHFTNYDIGFDR